MVGFVTGIAVLVILSFLVWRRGRDRRVANVPAARWLRIAAVVPLALQAAVFVLFGIGEMAGGDLSGAGHLLQLAPTVLLAVLAWLRPLEGGLALLAMGILEAATIVGAIAGAGEGAIPSPALLILAGPYLISGALFFLAGRLARRSS